MNRFYLAILFFFYTLCSTTGQISQYFLVGVNNTTCMTDDGVIIITALDKTIADFPLPYYVELVHNDANVEYHDMLAKKLFITGLKKGRYDLRIWLDYNNGCKIDTQLEINEEEHPFGVEMAYNCGTQCLDVKFTSDTGPYEVAWYKKNSVGYELIPGWPKYNLSGWDGNEDLCLDKMEGTFKVEISDAACGAKSIEKLVTPCDCLDGQLAYHKNVSSCEILFTLGDREFDECDGKLKLAFKDGMVPNILWSNGETTSEITELCTGNYTVTLTNNGCSKSFTYEICCCDIINPYNLSPDKLIACSETGLSDFTLKASFTNPTSSTNNDGSINLQIIGGAPSKSYSWVGPNNYKSNEPDIANLGPGIYTVSVTDGCQEKTLSVILIHCPSFEFVKSAKVFNSCPNMSQGRIILALNNNVSIKWNTLNQETSSSLDFLSPGGTYCADLVHTPSGCASKICYYISLVQPVTSLNINGTSNSCENVNTGSVEYSFISTGLAHYQINLFNAITNQNIGSHFIQNEVTGTLITKVFSNLGPGSYKIELKSSCDLLIEEFTINKEILNLNYTVNIGCENNNSVTVNPSGANPPFYYNWNYGLPPTAYQNNLKRAVYEVTVTDSKGCAIDTTINELRPMIEMIDKTKACSGMDDGSITIRINNPLHDNATITYGFSPGFDFPNFNVSVPDYTANPIEFTLSELSGIKEYEIRVEVNGCFEVYKFVIGEQKSTRRFSGFEEVGEDKILCTYDELCKDNVIPNNITEPATLKAQDGKCDGLAAGVAFGLFSDCGKVEFLCDSTKVHEKKVGTISLRVAEWLEWMITSGREYEINYLTLGDQCSYIRVCENMPGCLLGGGRSNFFGGHMSGWQALPNGCYKIICEADFFLLPAPDIIICGLDFLPDYIPFHTTPQPETKCKRVTKNLGELVAFKDQLTAKYGTLFTNSSLYQQVLLFQEDQRRFCANITYCLCESGDCNDHFKFIETNILDVVCEILDPPFNYGTYAIGATCKPEYFIENFPPYVFCSDHTLNIIPKLLNLYDFERFRMTRNNDWPDVVKYSENISTRFERFANTKIVSDYYTTDAIFKTDERHKFFHSFNTIDWTYNLEHEAEFVYQDFVTKTGMLIRRLNSAAYNFYNTQVSTGPTTFTYNSLYSVEGITGSNSNFTTKFGITNLSSYDNGYLIAGKTDTSYFQTLLNNSNSIIKKYVITGFKDSTYITTGQDFSTYVTRIPGTKIKVNNKEISTSFATKTSIIKVKEVILGGTVVEEYFSWVKKNRLIRVDENVISGQETFTFVGFGGFQIGGTTIPESNTEMLYLISYKKGVVYYKIIPFVGDLSNISMVSDNFGNTYLGLNFEGNIKTSDFNLNSKGQLDILLLKYNKDGTFLGYKQFGSEDKEILKDMFFDKSILHLGGDIEGNTTFRTIGELKFVKFDTLESHAFVSVTSSLDFNSNIIHSRNIKTESQQLNFDVKPNPTSSLVEIILDSPISESVGVGISNMNGDIVYSTILNKGQFNNSKFVLNLEHLPSGVYVIKLVLDGAIIPTKKIVKI